MNENKMAEVAAMFGKNLGERFAVVLNGEVISCQFTKYGLNTYGTYENPYIDLDKFVLADLLTGEAVIVDG